MSIPFPPEHEVNALLEGTHRDPFSILGPHSVDSESVIRALNPHSVAAEILTDSDAYQMDVVDRRGLYQLILPYSTIDSGYRIRYKTHEGHTYSVQDPYRFPSGLPVKKENSPLYEYMGAHLVNIDGVTGTRFAVWAPNAERVSVIGPFNNWDGRVHPMRFDHDSGIWDIFIPEIGQGTLYKYEIKTYYKGYVVNKTDPVGFFSEVRPKNASVAWEIDGYKWQDQEWVDSRPTTQAHATPMSVYELHLGSWRRKGYNGSDWLTYRETADQIIPYVKEMGYTHIELMPVSEHPLDASWGYQVTGFFAPTSRFGTPQDFMYLVDQCHQNGIGVILDWVPAHFPRDEHGLAFFDGTYLYEHADPRQGEHPDWGTKIFNYGRPEVQKFLIDNALFWLDKYHIDGLRVDAVASMLYLDFSREQGQWVPNRYGGRENIEALDFVRALNTEIHAKFPGTLTIAEESTAWSGVTRPVEDQGGLGFDFKWNMGWMHDTLRYLKTDPLFRSFHQGMLTFSLLYAFSEKYVLSFSHDEVVHMKGSMLGKMPGDDWQKFANLRALYGYQYAHPGRKLNFMGSEFGQWSEWNENKSLDWHLLELESELGEMHRGLKNLVMDLNLTYKSNSPFYIGDNSHDGFQWIDFRDARHSVLVFMRKDPENERNFIIAICNFTPEPRIDYRIGVPFSGVYREFLNTDHSRYGGSGLGNPNDLVTTEVAWQGLPHSLSISLPPLSVIYIKLTE